MAYFRASLPSKNSITGNPTNEVLPKPAVRIKHPTRCLFQFNLCPKILKKMKAKAKVIQETKQRAINSIRQCIKGTLSIVSDGRAKYKIKKFKVV
jgi:tRNA uridine 5-carbamoylmethylation protein Kti12